MKKTVKLLCLAMALMLALSSLAACGGEKSNKKDTAAKDAVKVIEIDLTEEEYAFGVDKTQPELLTAVNEFIAEIKADGTLDEICNRYFGDGEPQKVASAKEDSNKDQLVVATNAAFEPFEYTAGEYYLGIDMEIAALLAKKLNKELVIKHMDFDAVCLSVGQQKCDIAMAGLTIKPDREEYVNFSDSYYAASQRLIVKADDKSFDECKTVDDVTAILGKLDKKTKIGVQNGTTGQFYVEGDESWGFDGLKATCVGYKNGSLAVQDLVNGNIKYVIIDSAPAKCIAESINEMA